MWGGGGGGEVVTHISGSQSHFLRRPWDRDETECFKMADSNSGKRKRSKAFYVGQKKKVRYLICGLVSSNNGFCGNNVTEP